jgi:hypothetical protein
MAVLRQALHAAESNSCRCATAEPRLPPLQALLLQLKNKLRLSYLMLLLLLLPGCAGEPGHH